MARLNIKYTTPKVFNIDQSKRYLLPLSAEVYGGINILLITFDGIIDAGLAAAEAEDFSISMSGGPMTATSDAIVYAGVDYIALVVNRTFICDETGTITYTPGTYRIISTDGRKARKFTLDITGIEACTTTSTTTTEGFEDILYGLLYNWYAATDVRNICAAGWHIPTDAEIKILEIYMGMLPATADLTNPRGTTEGNEIKETGISYWTAPNTGATNEWGFNLRGSGWRTGASGLFSNMNIHTGIWCADAPYATQGWGRTVTQNSGEINRNGILKYWGISIRPIKDSTILSDGESSTMTGNDGKVYRTICIGTQEWLADNLAETKYRDGSDIPEVTNGVAWAALTSGALCAYNNDWSNV